MLTRDFNRLYYPGFPGVPEVPGQPERTVCQTPPAGGKWVYECERINLPSNGSIAIPPGGEMVVVYDPNGAIDPLTGQVKVVDVYIRVCSSKWVPSQNPPEPVCTTYPAVPYQPGVPAVPARWETRVAFGWGGPDVGAGANSVQTHEGDCEVKWLMGKVVGAVLGFTQSREAVPTVDRMTHAFYFHQRSGAPYFRVMESGASRSQDFPYAEDDEFMIRRARGVVSYWHNGVRLQDSGVVSAGEVSVGSALYASGDEVPSGGGGAPAPEPEPEPEPEPDPEPEGYRFYAYNTSTGDIYYGDLLDGETEVVVDTPHVEMTAFMAVTFNRFQCSLVGDPWTNGVVLDRRTASATRALTTMLHDGTQIPGGGLAPAGNRAPLIAVSSLERLYRLDHPTGSGGGPYSVRLVDPEAGTLLSDVFAFGDVENLPNTTRVGGFARTAKGQFIILRPDGEGMRMAEASGSSVAVHRFQWVVSFVLQDRLDPDRIIGVFNGMLATAEVFEDGTTTAMDVIAPVPPGQFIMGYGQQTEDGAMFVWNGSGVDMVTRDGNTTAITVSLPGGWPSINPIYYAVCRIPPADEAPS